MYTVNDGLVQSQSGPCEYVKPQTILQTTLKLMVLTRMVRAINDTKDILAEMSDITRYFGPEV